MTIYRVLLRTKFTQSVIEETLTTEETLSDDEKLSKLLERVMLIFQESKKLFETMEDEIEHVLSHGLYTYSNIQFYLP